MNRPILLLFFCFYSFSFAQNTFQNTRFDIPANLPSEEPEFAVQQEGVATFVKNDLKPVKVQKPASAAVLPQALPIALPQPAPLPQPAAPAMPTLAPFTLPTLPPHPTLAPFTLPTFPPHPTMAPFTIPGFTLPTPAPLPPIPGAGPVPTASDYDIPSNQPKTPEAKPQQPTAAPAQPQGQQPMSPQQIQQIQNYYRQLTPEWLGYYQQYYPQYYAQLQQYMQYYGIRVQPVAPTPAPTPKPVQPQIPVQAQIPLRPQAPVVQQAQQPQFQLPQQPVPQQQAVFHPQVPVQQQIRPLVVAAGVPSRNVSSGAQEIRSEAPSSVSRVGNWFREQFDTTECKKDLHEVARQFKQKFPAYLQKGGKDVALAELVDERLVECERKASTGHWDKVDSLLAKVSLSKSEEGECRAGLIQERISCYNLLNYACQFTAETYKFKLVPARITIQEARQAENGAEKCRKVVRLVKKRLEG